MDSNFEHRWRSARTLENSGRVPEAKTLYESMLEEDPGRLYVRMRLSSIEQRAGRYRAARELAIRCADDVRTTRWNDLAAVTRRLLTFDEQDLVVALIRGADWRHPDIVRNSAVLSQHLWLCNRHDDALALIEAAEERAQPNAVLRYSKANVLRYLGRMDDAAAEYERCLALAPDFAFAHWSLSSHCRASPPDARIARIERARAKVAPDAEEAPYLDYALFREYDGVGDVERAWEHLVAGAAAKRASLAYDAATEAAGFEALLQRGADAFRPVARDVGAGPVPIFILGMPRTGTTLVERLLGGHSAVEAGGELNDVESALALATDRFPQRQVTVASVEAMLSADFDAVGRTYLARTEARANGKRYLTDKNPANFLHAGFIAKALPEAKILCLRRDPMDACLSNLKELFTNDQYAYSYDLAELAAYYLRFDRLCRHWKHVIPDRFMEVQYEALATDTERVVREMLAFCGLPFEADCLDITANTAPVSTASSSQVRQPIHSRGIGAWRKYEAFLEPLRAGLAAGTGA